MSRAAGGTRECGESKRERDCSTKRKNLDRVVSEVNTYLERIPVIGCNSQNYDLNILRAAVQAHRHKRQDRIHGQRKLGNDLRADVRLPLSLRVVGLAAKTKIDTPPPERGFLQLAER